MKYKTALPRLFEFIRKACVISLLPPEFFETGLQVVRNEARQADILIAYLLRQFFTYVQDKWLGHVSRKNWMTFYNALHRTNNSCETLNRLLRKAVGAYRPNVYLFMDALARLEHNAHLDIALMQEGGSARRNRRWQSVYSDRQLKALMEDLEMDVFHDRNTAVSNFLERAADLVQGVFKEHLEHDAGQV